MLRKMDLQVNNNFELQVKTVQCHFGPLVRSANFSEVTFGKGMGRVKRKEICRFLFARLYEITRCYLCLFIAQPAGCTIITVSVRLSVSS